VSSLQRVYSPFKDYPESIGLLFGQVIPGNVTDVEVVRKASPWPGDVVNWRTREGHRHSMDVDPDNIEALIVAMRMSC
jgi:hypothetical protein